MSTLAIRRRAVACPAALMILLSVAAAPAPAATRCSAASARPAALSGGARHAAAVCEINRVRRHHGLAPVSAHARLTRMAHAFAQTMVTRRFFSHVGPGGATLAIRRRAAGYRGRAIGEVLAWGQGRYASPRAAVRSWLRSPQHRRVLLGRNYRDVGVGIALGSPFGGSLRSSATYVAEFGA
jgi:uncharacterized protein YkwD